MGKRKSLKEFIEEAIKVHGNKYDYSKVEYVNNRTKICIICPEHGEFWQTPSHHLNGNGCRKCQYKGISIKFKLSLEEWVKKASLKHENKYCYDKVDFINKKENGKVCIICPEHGEFWQLPNIHMHGEGCPLCGRKKANKSEMLTTEGFIERAKNIHGDKYDYSKTIYKGWLNKLDIICDRHGLFSQTAGDHLHGAGCPHCKKEVLQKLRSSNTEDFIKKAKEIHNKKYIYDKVEYIKSNKKVCIICPKHGEFWQIPGHHLHGVGCPFCRESKMEKELYSFLSKNKIKAERQYRNEKFGGLSLDFYLPDYNIAIECQGEQHFKPIKHFGGEKKFLKCQERDGRKAKLCEENGIKLLYFARKKYNEKIFTDKEELLEEIKKQT